MQIEKEIGKVVTDTGKEYWFHEKQTKNPHLKCRYFSKDKTGAIPIPDGYKVVANTRTGMVMLKKDTNVVIGG